MKSRPEEAQVQRPRGIGEAYGRKHGGHAAQAEHVEVRRGAVGREEASVGRGLWAMARPSNFMLHPLGNPGKVLNWGGTCSD